MVNGSSGNAEVWDNVLAGMEVRCYENGMEILFLTDGWQVVVSAMQKFGITRGLDLKLDSYVWNRA